MLKKRLFWLPFICVLPLCAQTPVTEHQLGAYKGNDDAIQSAMSYCDAIDDSSTRQTPLIFAMSPAGLPNSSSVRQWKQFASRDDWEAASRPSPLAFVWDQNGSIVKLTIMSRPPRFWNPAVGTYRRTEYCYGADATLIRIRAAWYAPTQCEFLFPCQLIAGHEFYLGGQAPAVTDWVFIHGGQIRKLRNGELIKDYFDPSWSLDARDLHLTNSDALPFRSASEQLH